MEVCYANSFIMIMELHAIMLTDLHCIMLAESLYTDGITIHYANIIMIL